MRGREYEEVCIRIGIEPRISVQRATKDDTAGGRACGCQAAGSPQKAIVTTRDHQSNIAACRTHGCKCSNQHVDSLVFVDATQEEQHPFRWCDSKASAELTGWS